MSKILIEGGKVIIDGHASDLETCNTLTNLCDELSTSEKFRTVKYESGYGEFESVSENGDKKFPPAQVLITINSNDGTEFLHSLTISPGSTITVTSIGLSVSDNSDMYSYTGNQTFLGVSTKANSTSATLPIGSTFRPEDVGGTLYIVEGSPFFQVDIKTNDGTTTLAQNATVDSVAVTSTGVQLKYGDAVNATYTYAGSKLFAGLATSANATAPKYKPGDTIEITAETTLYIVENIIIPDHHSSLTELFTNIAAVIRNKTGSTEPIIADAFPTAIDAIPSGGDDSLVTSIIDGTITEIAHSGIETIGSYAFYSRSLTSASFPACTSIDAYAFAYCSRLTSVNFPVCTSIGDSPFRNCSSLTSVNFPECTSIGDYAFAYCTGLTSVNFPKCTNIADRAFNYCSSLTSASFPACTSIGYNAFASCSRLTSVNFPVCTSIGYSAFSGCTSLTSASFPACTSIDAYAFYYCTSLTTANFPECTSIGSNAFVDCIGLTSASFPACTSIGPVAFQRCNSLTSVNFPECTSIGNHAFVDCIGLTSASFPVCTSIGSYAFNNCTSLTGASFPACTTIGDRAFSGCTSLTSVNFPECTSIGNSVFSKCTSLTTASFPECTSIGRHAFVNCYNLISLSLGASSVCSLPYSNAFVSTPIGGYSASAGQYGSIFVPASLLASYKAATNWSYFSSRFVGY